MTTNFTLPIEAEDRAFFMRLMAVYYDDRDNFKSMASRIILGNDESQGSDYNNQVSVKKSNEFYSSIKDCCTCGSCLNRFARPSRTPWRAIGNGQFVNAEHGHITLVDCDFRNYQGAPGYVFKSLKDIQADEKRANKIKHMAIKKQKTQKISEISSEKNVSNKDDSKIVKKTIIAAPPAKPRVAPHKPAAVAKDLGFPLADALYHIEHEHKYPFSFLKTDEEFEFSELISAYGEYDYLEPDYEEIFHFTRDFTVKQQEQLNCEFKKKYPKAVRNKTSKYAKYLESQTANHFIKEYNSKVSMKVKNGDLR